MQSSPNIFRAITLSLRCLWHVTHVGVLVWKPESKGQVARYKHRQEGNFKMDLTSDRTGVV